MSENAMNSVLRRKVSLRSRSLEQREMSPGKAMRLAVERAAERLASLEATISEFREDEMSLAGLVDSLQDPHLIYKMSGPGGAIGLAIWNMAAVSALVEHLITGRIGTANSQSRAPTPTEAAILSELLNQIMLLFDEGLEQITDGAAIRGYRQADTFADGRAVAMFFDDMPFRHYRIGLNLGNSVEGAELRLLYPDRPIPGAGTHSQGDTSWKRDWQNNVKESRIAIEAVLIRLQLPLEQVMKFEVGTEVTIPIDAIGNVSIEGSDQRCVAHGRLGQSNGCRAVRILSLPRSGTGPSSPQNIAFATSGTASDKKSDIATDQVEMTPPLPLE